MVVNGRPLKRMKRRVTADLYDFLTFPSSSDDVSVTTVPFRVGVKAFLMNHALLPPPSSLLPHLMTWQILFRVGDSMDGPDAATVCVDVVEEDVARSRSVYCDQCRVVGWSGHPVCAKRYHFIVKADGNSIGGYYKSSMRFGDFSDVYEARPSSSNGMTTDDVEDWVYQQLEDTSHLLHGIVHANGYGHLLRVNGREGGSKFLSGCRIMDFWDRLCRTLSVRKISVMDVSKKYGLDYRLLHAVTKGHPWYGDWGYEFGAGSFALTADAYKSSVEELSKVPLSVFLPQGRKPRTHLEDIISFYQSLAGRELVNIKDLFSYLVKLIHDAHKGSPNNSCKKTLLCTSKNVLSWTRDDVEKVEEAMFRVLRAVSGSTWVSWRALRGAVCKVAPPELLDRCLKELGGKLAAGGMIVSTRSNPTSGASEYRLEPGNESLDVGNGCHNSSPVTVKCPPEDILVRDLRFLYGFLLHPQTMLSYTPEATRDLAVSAAEKLLDCKQFVKNYTREKKLPTYNFCISILCEVELTEEFGDSPILPPELLVLPLHAVMADLKVEASRAFQEVYISLRRFQAEEVIGYGGVDDFTPIKNLFGLVESVRIRGRCLGKNNLHKFRMERGLERWTVDCSCGAKDDDGERMLACDVCGVWQHTRCSGINDSDAVPARFVCCRCGGVGHGARNGRQCKDELSRGGMGGGSGKRLTTPYDVV